MGLLSALKRGLKSAAGSSGPGAYSSAGKRISCPHCGMDRFAEGSAQLNTAGMTFLHLDWANKSATTLACTSCGRIQWFMQRPQRM